MLSRAEIALSIAKNVIDIASREINNAIPADHQLIKAMSEARLAFAKADVLNSDMLKRFKR